MITSRDEKKKVKRNVDRETRGVLIYYNKVNVKKIKLKLSFF